MRRASRLLLAGVAAGTMAVVGAAPSVAAEREPTSSQKMRAKSTRTSAHYYVEMTYEGRRWTVQNILVGGAVIRVEKELRTGRYEAKTTRPARLTARCVGAQSRLLPAALEGARGACSSIRKRASDLLEGAARVRYLKSHDRWARTAYEFGGPGRSIKLRGQVSDGYLGRSSGPVQMARRGNQGGLVTVTCDPDTRTTEHLQQSPQDGLVIRLISGRARPGRSASLGVRRTTSGGVQVTSSVEGGRGIEPARYQETVNELRCPGVDGSQETVLRGRQVELSRTWFPLDRALSFKGPRRPEALLRRDLDRLHRVGRFFAITGRFKRSRDVNERSSLTQVVEDNHRWKLVFYPCESRAIESCDGRGPRF